MEFKTSYGSYGSKHLDRIGLIGKLFVAGSPPLAWGPKMRA
jgi:hypothetical protein